MAWVTFREHSRVTSRERRSIGRTIEVSAQQETAPNSQSYTKTITYKGFAAADRTITIESGLMSTALRSGGVSTNALLFFPGVYEPDKIVDLLVVKKLKLPDNQEYGFKYNSCGEVAEVKLPTGGRYEYDWDGASAPGQMAIGTCRGLSRSVQRYLTHRRAYTSTALV